MVLAFASFENTVASVVGGVVGAADTVEDVFAEVSGVGAVRVAGLEAEGIATDEAGRRNTMSEHD